MKKNNTNIWPYAIAISIFMIFGASVATVVIASKAPVEKSDTYMMGYHDADANANELIEAQIEFDKKYKIEYVTDTLTQENTIIKYKVSDLSGNRVENAKIKVMITRPDSHALDKELNNPTFKDGVYTFETIKLEKEGRWDIMAQVSVGMIQRYYNVKTDTRVKKATEY